MRSVETGEGSIWLNENFWMGAETERDRSDNKHRLYPRGLISKNLLSQFNISSGSLASGIQNMRLNAIVFMDTTTKHVRIQLYATKGHR